MLIHFSSFTYLKEQQREKERNREGRQNRQGHGPPSGSLPTSPQQPGPSRARSLQLGNLSRFPTRVAGVQVLEPSPAAPSHISRKPHQEQRSWEFWLQPGLHSLIQPVQSFGERTSTWKTPTHFPPALCVCVLLFLRFIYVFQRVIQKWRHTHRYLSYFRQRAVQVLYASAPTSVEWKEWRAQFPGGGVRIETFRLHA